MEMPKGIWHAQDAVPKRGCSPGEMESTSMYAVHAVHAVRGMTSSDIGRVG